MTRVHVRPAYDDFDLRQLALDGAAHTFQQGRQRRGRRIVETVDRTADMTGPMPLGRGVGRLSDFLFAGGFLMVVFLTTAFLMRVTDLPAAGRLTGTVFFFTGMLKIYSVAAKGRRRLRCGRIRTRRSPE